MAMGRNNREKILATARKLFLRYGYNGISIRAIAHSAKLTTGAIYFHFHNKRDIYRTICNEAIELLINKFKEGIEKRKTVNQKLISIYDSYLDFYEEHRDYYNILMEYKADYSQDGDDEFTKKFMELIHVTAETFALGVSKGAFRNIDPLLLSLFLAAVTEGMIQYKKLGVFAVCGVDDNVFRKFMADVVGRGIEIHDNIE
jgi:AcrR family transcriptional regulator